MEEILQDGLERRDTGAAAGHTWEEDGKTFYHVVFGDSFQTIAQKFGTTVKAITELNPELFHGREKIYAGWDIRVL